MEHHRLAARAASPLPARERIRPARRSSPTPPPANFRELSGSPTVGTGATRVRPPATTDLDGLPWASPPDIGAYQLYNAPTCKAVSASTKFGTAVSLHLQCSDALGDPMTLAIKTGPAWGKLSSIGSGGLVTYTPNTGYSGSDSFTYTGTSKLGTSAPATVSITVGSKPPGQKVAPVISHAKQSKGVFTFTLNERATVTLTFKLHGHVRGTLKITGKRGRNTVRVKGRLSKHHKLKAGAYVVTLAASNAGGRSKPVKVKYKLASAALTAADRGYMLRRMGMRTGTLAFVVAFALTPAAASAADRFASPTGTGFACTQVAPCDIVTAVNSASNGDDITIEPGTYGSPTLINTNLTDSGTYQLTIHGEAGQPRPVIDTTAAYGFYLTDGSTLQ